MGLYFQFALIEAEHNRQVFFVAQSAMVWLTIHSYA